MTNKLGKVMTSLDGLLPIMSHDPLVTRPCEIRGSLTGGGLARKRLSLIMMPALLVGVVDLLCVHSQATFLLYI